MRVKILALSILLLSGASCSRSPHEFKLTRLPSGREARIVVVFRKDFSQTSEGLVLHYETDTPLDDQVTLRKEVDEVWEYLKEDLERERLKEGIIRVMRIEGILFKSREVRWFVFVKQGDGTWQCTEDAKK